VEGDDVGGEEEGEEGDRGEVKGSCRVSGICYWKSIQVEAWRWGSIAFQHCWRLVWSMPRYIYVLRNPQISILIVLEFHADEFMEDMLSWSGCL
jgi:hypothetical protein